MPNDELKQRFARQLVLSEIGETGQARLCASTVRIPSDAEPRAAAIATAYLERAGMRVHAPHESSTTVAEVPDTALVAALTGGDAVLEHAAAALAGAFAAVETMKRVLEVGDEARLDTVALRPGGAR